MSQVAFTFWRFTSTIPPLLYDDHEKLSQVDCKCTLVEFNHITFLASRKSHLNQPNVCYPTCYYHVTDTHLYVESDIKFEYLVYHSLISGTIIF